MFNQENIRNFAILSHIDHGKSTLADRFLELTGTVPKEKMRPQYLDMMDLEREKGITIKMQPVRMQYTLNLKSYILNLIDTPGHVDFSYEVSRALAAVEGAILLVDATKGIQAQTVANLELAKKPTVHTQQKLVIIPAVNKIDLPNAKVEETTKELANLLGIDKNEIIKISAKYGINIKELLEAVIKKIPCPKATHQNLVDGKNPLRALIFDSKYDPFKGVLAYVRLVDGEIKTGDKIYLMAQKSKGEAREIGFFRPGLTPQAQLITGEIGYIATGIKESGKVRVGDTIIKSKIKYQKSKIIEEEPLPGYKEPKPMVFASIYPEHPDDFDLLKDALAKLKLNDASLTFEPEMRETLGRGFLCGFLGNLHAEIVLERLHREFDLNLVMSTPSVVSKIIDKANEEIFIKSAANWPDPSQIKEIQEPWIKLEVMTPSNYLGTIFEMLKEFQAKHIKTKYFGQDRVFLIYEAPLREVIVGFYDKILSATQGYASLNYEILGFKTGDLVKLEILIAGQKEEAFSKLVPKNQAFKEGSNFLKKLKKILPPQLFAVSLQAQVAGRIIARETIKAKRRDVISPLYGGDYTRKRKLLERQKRGKEKLKEKGRVRIPPNVFLEMMRE